MLKRVSNEDGGAPPGSRPPTPPAASACLHKYVFIQSLTKTGGVLQGAGQRIEGILCLFFCERCLELQARNFNFGPPAEG